jgi:hypothetical protein
MLKTLQKTNSLTLFKNEFKWTQPNKNTNNINFDKSKISEWIEWLTHDWEDDGDSHWWVVSSKGGMLSLAGKNGLKD